MSVTAMKAGAIEFLTKPFRDQDFLDAVHRGIDLDRGRRAESAILADLRERFSSLTPREREIMMLVAAGQLNKQIAAELQLSEITVKVHRAQAMRKMQAKSLPDLVRFADKLRSDEHTSELQSLMRTSYAVFCLKKKQKTKRHNRPLTHTTTFL